MNLREILTEEYFNNTDIIQGKYLELLLPLISKSKEFEKCDLKLSTQHTEVLSQTQKLVDGKIIEGEFFIHSITETPVIYDPNIIHLPIKDGCCITPTFYDPLTFSPYKNIVLHLPLDGDDDVLKRKHLHILLDKIIDNENNEYSAKGKKGLLIKGYFSKNKKYGE